MTRPSSAVLLLSTFLLIGCGQRAERSPLGLEMAAAAKAAGDGPPEARDRPRAQALDRVAARWFPVGMSEAEVRRILAQQHMKIIVGDGEMLPEGMIRGDGERCGLLSCRGPYADIEIRQGRVTSAQVIQGYTDVFHW